MRVLLICVALAGLAACSPPAATTTETTTATVSAVATTTQATDASGINVAAPLANAHVTSPLIATGTAQNAWYFEAVFSAKLVGADGAVIAEGPAQAQTDWTKEGPVPFRAQLTFQVAADTPATLVLQEDMPPDEDHPDNRPTREIKV